MKVALVHDWLLRAGGGEKVFEALCEVFQGPIYTLLKNEQIYPSFANRNINTSFLQRLPYVNRYYQNLLPFFPGAIESFDLSAYDLIISSSHAVAKSIRTHSNQLHICYCHTPMRYAWDLHEFYLDQLNPIKRMIARPILYFIKHWDQKTHSRVNHFITNSKHVAKRIEKNYGCTSAVINPPVDTHLFEVSSDREDYYVTCSRLVPYKRIDILVSAFAKMPQKNLRIIGDGPEMKKLKSRATDNVTFLGYLPHPALQKVLSRARAFLFAAEEEFGIAIAEAQAAGIPAIVYGYGGAQEIVLPAQTGIFFKEQTAESLMDAVSRFEKMEADFEPEKIRKNALRFSKERFQREIKEFVDNQYKAFRRGSN